MAEVKTKSGFVANIADDAMDDWDILTYFREIDRGNIGAIADVAPILLGDEQLSKLKEHLKLENGKVKASDMIIEVSGIIEELKQAKKS